MNETLRIVLGYVIFFVYMGLVLVVGELLRRLLHLNADVCRKGEHLATSLCWLLCYWLTGPTYHTFIINAVGFVLLAVITLCGIFKSVERTDAGKSYGVLFFGLSTAIVMGIAVFVNTDFYLFTGITYYALALGDGLAPIVAKLTKKYNFKITEKKTFMGTFTVFVLSSLSAIVFDAVFGLNFSALMILSLGALAAIVELFSEKCTDNLTIVFFLFGYLVMNYYGLVTLPLQVGLLIILPMVILDGALHALTPAANCAATIFLVLSSYFVGYPMLVMVLVLYVISGIIGAVSNLLYRRMGGEKQSTSRNVIQIIANSSVALLCTIVWYVSKLDVFLWAAYAAIAEEFADAVASDIGKLSSKPPRNILGFKRMQTGISGGLSILGTAGALIASAGALLIPLLFSAFDWRYFCLLSAVAFVGTLVDSLLGSAFQVLYRCPVCGKQTEKKTHCDGATEYVKGIKWVDNSCVNLAAGVMTALMAALALLL